MNTVTHTPGPWRASDGGSIEAQMDGQWVQIALLSRTQWTFPDQGKNERLRETRQGDLYLMTEAPELLAALKALADFAEPFICMVGDPQELTAARAAIAKAEGKSTD